MSSLLDLDGRATFTNLNARKEGKGDVKVLAVDLKLNLVTDNEVLIHFHPQLRVMLFDKDGKARFPLMGPVPWEYTFNNMYVEIHPDVHRPLTFHACRLESFEFFAKDNGKVRLGFAIKVKPSDGDFEIIGRILAESVRLKVRSDNLDLFAPARAEPQRAAPEPESEPEPIPAHKAHAAEEASVEVDGDDNVVAAINGAGTPLGMRLNKKKHPVGSWLQDAGITYDVVAQGEKTITLLARSEPTEPLPEIELTPAVLAAMKAAGQAEAAKFDDDRDFDTGFVKACEASGLPRAFVEENLVELQAAFTDGYEEETEQPE